jgi:hypothetical protein
MTATSRLFWIELRRSTALLTIPVLVGLALLAWYLFQQDEQHVSYHWPDASEDIGVAAIFLGPAAGGLAAWAAGRDRRHGLGDLLRTTPRPAVSREINLLSATTAWIVVAYAAAGIYLGVTTALKATWGGPVLAPILIGLLAITVQAAIGFAAGSFSASLMQSRLITAMVPVVLFFAELAPTLFRGKDRPCGEGCMASSYPYDNLSPVSAIESLGGSIFWSTPTDIAWGALAWLGGFGGLALALILVRHRPRSGVAWGLVAAAAATIGFGWSQLVPAPVVGSDIPSSHAIAYEPVCVQRSIPICLHPANESFLDLTADLIDDVVRPIAGLTGAPLRAEQIAESKDGNEYLYISNVPDAIPAVPAFPNANPQVVATAAAVGAVRGPTDDPFALTPAQGAIVSWLLRQAGWEGLSDGVAYVSLPDNAGGQPGPASPRDDYEQAIAEVELAADRFAALAPAEQRAWLETNLMDLRAGTLGLEELP